ncbi:hypothetical protein ACHQM5_019410 [Ranunculus cassubicifolius]
MDFSSRPVAKRTRAQKLVLFKEYMEIQRKNFKPGTPELVDLVGSDDDEENSGGKDHYCRKKRAKNESFEPTTTLHGGEYVHYGRALYCRDQETMDQHMSSDGNEEVESESESEEESECSSTADDEYRLSDPDFDVEEDNEEVVAERQFRSDDLWKSSCWQRENPETENRLSKTDNVATSDDDSEPILLEEAEASKPKDGYRIANLKHQSHRGEQEVGSERHECASADGYAAVCSAGAFSDARDNRGVFDEDGTEGHCGEAMHMGGAEEVECDSETLKKEHFVSESYEEVVAKGRMYILLDNKADQYDKYDIGNSLAANGGDGYSRGSHYAVVDDGYIHIMDSESEISGQKDGDAEDNMECLSDERDEEEEVDRQCSPIDPRSDTSESKILDTSGIRDRNDVAYKVGYDTGDNAYFDDDANANVDNGYSDPDDACQGETRDCGINRKLEGRCREETMEVEASPLMDYGEKLNLEFSLDAGFEFDEKEEEEVEQQSSVGDSRKASFIQRKCSETGDNIGDNNNIDDASASATVADSSYAHKDGARVDKGGPSDCHIGKRLEGDVAEVMHTVDDQGGYQKNGPAMNDGIGLLPPFVPFLPMGSSVPYQLPGPYAYHYPPRYLPPTQPSNGNRSRQQRPRNYRTNQIGRNQSYHLRPYRTVRSSPAGRQSHHLLPYPLVRNSQVGMNHSHNMMHSQCGNYVGKGSIYGSSSSADRTSFHGNLTRGSDTLHDLNRGPRSKGFKSNGYSITTPIRIQYNKEDFSVNYIEAKFFIIMSRTEDDIHKSIKYNIWTSTSNGRKTLDAKFKEAKEKSNECPVFLFFSVDKSEQFVGLAEMMGRVSGSSFRVKWHIVKDIPYNFLKNRPVMQSEDIQEVMLEQGLVMMKRFKDYYSKTCILDDFEFYNDYEDLQRLVQNKAKKQGM